jgi:hypothetical protein
VEAADRAGTGLRHRVAVAAAGGPPGCHRPARSTDGRHAAAVVRTRRSAPGVGRARGVHVRGLWEHP